eukprot:Nk52_evm4s317 gene=Nk52_evmTU4s317
MTTLSSAKEQFKLLMWKIYLYRKRKLISTLFEIIFPIFFFVNQMTSTPRNDSPQPATIYPPSNPYGDWNSTVNFAYLNMDGSNISSSTLNQIISQWETELQTFPFLNSTVNPSQANFKLFTDMDLLEDWCGTTGNACQGAVVFEGYANGKDGSDPFVSYSIRVDPSLVPNTGNVYNSFVNYISAQPYTVGDNYYEDDMKTFWTIQFTMDRALSEVIFLESTGSGSSSDDIPSINLVKYPFPEWNLMDVFFRESFQNIGMSMMLGWIYLITVFVRSIVEEKETRLKEAAKMLGLRNWINWVTHFTGASVVFLPSVVVFTLVVFGLGKYSEIQILFFFFLGCALSVICMGLLLSTLFDNSKVAAAGTAVFFFLSVFPTFFMDSNNWVVVGGFVKILGCFLSPTAWSLGAVIISYQEDFGVGVTTSNIADEVAGGEISFLSVLVMLYVDSIIYLLLALYIDAVFPGRYGVPQKWNYLVTKEYWKELITTVPEEENDFQQRVEPNDAEEDPSTCEAHVQNSSTRIGVQIRNLHKEFNGFAAVNNLSLNVYENEITALLGHNGAGKTTTMNMLTGIFKSSSGDAIVNGYSIRSQMNMVRQSVGLCPQFDILYHHMSVAEHLRFYCILKNVASEKVEMEIDVMLKEIQLEDKANFLVHELSGGMRRKLSVAIALIGNSKVVFMDEPTAGMDPFARRTTWELILKNKKNRTILLTTHLMDEADLLGDRIAVVHSGRLFTCGSSMFLKSKYGEGFHLTTVKSTNCKVKVLTSTIRRHAPQARIKENLGGEISYTIPKTSSKAMPQLLKELEMNGDALGITSCGVSETTLEEVFLNIGLIARAQEEEDNVTLNEITNEGCTDGKQMKAKDEVGGCVIENISTETQGREKKSKAKYQMYMSMFAKKIHTSKRNKGAFLAQLLIPLLFVLLGIAMLASSSDEYEPNTSLEMDLSIFSKYPFEMDSLVSTTSQSNYVYSLFQETANPSVSTLVNETLNTSSLDSFNEHLIKLQTFSDPTVTYISVYASSEENYSAYYNNKRSSHSSSVSLNFVDNLILRQMLNNSKASVHVSNWPLPSTSDDLQQAVADDGSYYGLAVFLLFGFSFMTSYFSMNAIDERVNHSKHMQFITGVDPFTYWSSFFVWDYITFLVPALCVGFVFLIYNDYRFVGENFAPLLVNVLAFGWASIPMAYVCSFHFHYPATEFLFVLLVNAIISDIFLMITQIFVSSTSPVNNVLQWVFSIIPGYALSNDISQIAQDATVRKVQPSSGYGAWDIHTGSRGLVVMLLEGVLFLFLLFLIERQSKKIQFESDEDEVDNQSGEVMDIDVKKEMERVNNGGADVNCVKVNNLQKTYTRKGRSNFKAVKGLTFGIPAGECFGLLGVNGAGKTTTFKMLTGDIKPSGGDAFINQCSIVNTTNEARAYLGYCPQYDALLEQLNAYEVLSVYGRLRGIEEKHLEGEVKKMIDNMGLTGCAGRLCGTYSGGNKRKLSTAVAMIGGPKVIFLDEPTAGMDPHARRYVWNQVSSACNEGRSVVLTSHSMEECEALCSRIAIMVNGGFKCIGSRGRD